MDILKKHMQAHSPELALDTIINIRLGELLHSEKSAQHTVVEIFSPHAHISICHKLSEDGPPPSSVDRQLHVSEIIVESHRLHWYQNFHYSPQSTISTSFEGLSLKTTVDSATPVPANSQNRGTSSNVFAFNHRRVCIEYVGGQLELACDLAVTKLEHDAPQILVDVYRRFRSDTALAKGEIISRVLMSTDGKAIIDPLSTIQPSYLVQGGRPYKLRTDLIFRFLFHLRNCLGHLRSSRCQLSYRPVSVLIPLFFFFHFGGNGCIGHCHDSISLEYPNLIDERILAIAMTDLRRFISFIISMPI